MRAGHSSPSRARYGIYFCDFNVWFMIHFYHCNAVYNTMIYSTALRHSTIFQNSTTVISLFLHDELPWIVIILIEMHFTFSIELLHLSDKIVDDNAATQIPNLSQFGYAGIKNRYAIYLGHCLVSFCLWLMMTCLEDVFEYRRWL